MMTFGTVTQHKAAVAIGAFHEGFVAHFQIDARMAQTAPNPVAGDARGIDFNDFGHFDRHGTLFWTSFLAGGGIIVLTI